MSCGGDAGTKTDCVSSLFLSTCDNRMYIFSETASQFSVTNDGEIFAGDWDMPDRQRKYKQIITDHNINASCLSRDTEFERYLVDTSSSCDYHTGKCLVCDSAKRFMNIVSCPGSYNERNYY